MHACHTKYVAHTDPPNQWPPNNGNNTSRILYTSQTIHRGHVMQVVHAYNTGQASMPKEMQFPNSDQSELKTTHQMSQLFTHNPLCGIISWASGYFIWSDYNWSYDQTVTFQSIYAKRFWKLDLFCSYILPRITISMLQLFWFEHLLNFFQWQIVKPDQFDKGHIFFYIFK